ncbi:MAG: hypothetical protein A3J82_05880 [Elusimicrobia bacterium RIFOXYA2_FULL_69_6]|nr:MAG: hypothetical protein A3J82_05880 [Elusimicrobia bacterium RIFOXYA2_FULL_69_6]
MRPSSTAILTLSVEPTFSISLTSERPYCSRLFLALTKTMTVHSATPALGALATWMGWAWRVWTMVLTSTPWSKSILSAAAVPAQTSTAVSAARQRLNMDPPCIGTATAGL